MNKLLQLGLCVLTLFSVLISQAQTIKSINFNSIEVSEAEAKMAGTAQIQATGAKYFLFDLNGLQSQLDGMMHREHENSGFIAQISLPHPDGTFHLYNAKENSTMHPELAEKFKTIGSYDAQGVDNQAFVKWDLTPQGLHAMIMIPGESTIFIDPLIAGQSDYYIVYNKKGFITDKIRDCSFNSDISQLESKQEATSGSVKSFGSCDLRTYRLALSATGEYTIFQGGTLALAQAAQVTTMNRVNGVFEKDMAITMVIIPNNDLIIYTSTADPFTNGNPGSMINENQSNTDAVIGNGNYDIGHVFGTNSGGLAGLGVVCNNAGKARGVTGSSAPTGDSFDIDYVAHEMGHQFGGNHTFNNSCNNNRNNGTAVEPGSGTTIMAYAGICAPDIQNNSDDHFSGISLEEFGNEILSAGHTCEVITPLANIAPVISSTIGAVTVPANTPFALTAVASDADGDLITYNWEQMDTEISTQSPVANATGGPNFRSIPSLTSPTRYFPNLTDLANGGPYTWEVLPSVTRTMNFRVTIRDNSNGAGGCNDHSDITLTTDANSGPFIVTYPNATGINWMALTSETVTWDVANTDVAPVSCSNVDIFLSVDGGLTYPITLATNTPNDGTQIITVPNSATTQARIMVMNSNGTFFDISDNNFTITALANDYTLSASPASVSICQPSDATYTIDIGSLDGYSDLVSLSVSGVPAGATSSITPATVTPAGSATLLISNTASVTPGTYTITIDATSTTGPKSFELELIIGNSSPASISLSSPLNGAVNEVLPTSFNWIASSEIGASYEVEIATDMAFSTVIDGASGLSATSYVSNGLLVNTTYYWRVRYTTSCGVSAWSTVFSFTTNGCSEFVSTDTPILISAAGTPTITSIINIPAGGTINDVNVLNINGTHAWIKNLTVTLTSPLGTIVPLFTQVCNNQDDFNLGFDDASGLAALPCPPIGGLSYQPEGLLSSFNGENSTGNWILTISDGNTNNGGELLGWTLEVCVDPGAVCNSPDLPGTSGGISICSGNTATLSVTSGNLNDATNWEWYETSCGGTPIGTGTSVIVSPTVNTSYFVRGEGGCVVPGACTQVDVIVNPIFNETASASICQGATYTFGLQSLTTSGTYTELFTSSNGCDSTVTLTLDVITSFNETASASICQGDTYGFGAQSLTSAGTYTELFTSSGGCDSTVILTLSVNPIFNEIASASICQGDTYVFGSQSLTSAGTYTELFTSSGGCDSTIVLTLSVNPTYNETASASICQGDTYTLGAQSLTISGTYTELFTSMGGCDSTVVLTLSVNPIYNESASTSICQGATYTFGLQSLTTAGTYTELFTSSNGCDSTVTLTLDVITSFNETASASICQGDTYGFGAQSLTSAGTYTELFTSSGGCDSTVVLTLSVNPTYNETVNATICSGEMYTFPDGSISAMAETQTSVLASISGCDSIIVTSLSVQSIDVSVNNGGATLTANQTGAEYIWIDCSNGNSPITGETGITFTPTATTGNYAVIVTIGSCSDTSDCILVDNSGLEENNINQVLIYPNPTSDEISINWIGEIKSIEITDTKGKVLKRVEQFSGQSLQLKVNNYANGVYFVHVVSDLGSSVHDIVKH